MVKPTKVLSFFLFVLRHLIIKVRKIADIKASWVNELKVLLEKKKACLIDIKEEIEDIEKELENLMGGSEVLKPGAELLLLAHQQRNQSN